MKQGYYVTVIDNLMFIQTSLLDSCADKIFILYEGVTLNGKFNYLKSVLKLYQKLFHILPEFIIKNHPNVLNDKITEDTIFSSLQIDRINYFTCRYWCII